MLNIGKSNDVNFKVDVNGTSALPTVRLIISANGAELGFLAEKSTAGKNAWTAKVFIPEHFASGEYDFRIEAVVDNRLFTPIKRKVSITKSFATVAPAVPEVTDVPEASTPLPKLASIKKPESILSATQPKSLMKSVVRTSVVERAQVKAKIEPLHTKISKAVDLPIVLVKHKPVDESISQLKIKQQTPISLKKGEIIYQ